ncbi:MAG: phospholipase A, partial [Polaromonas sp.]|nr:phospholipase A [Polaromonas sp.]
MTLPHRSSPYRTYYRTYRTYRTYRANRDHAVCAAHVTNATRALPLAPRQRPSPGAGFGARTAGAFVTSGLALALALCTPTAALAQTAPPPPGAAASRATALGWQVCQAMAGEAAAQLTCYQDWAASQNPANTPPAETTQAPANPATGQPAMPVLLLPSLNTEAPDGKPIGCRNNAYSELSRFWELQRATDCGNFDLRGFRPLVASLVVSNTANNQQTSTGLGATALTAERYGRTETKIQLSVRTKVAKSLLKSDVGDDGDQDSLWVAYSQKSYWQLFNSALSRPFRTTDHEPELIYVYPHQIALPGVWNYRLSGLGLVHQSNGQALPLSRSWNRAYLLGAAEKILGQDASLRLQARVWERLGEAGEDENPGIQSFIGRSELVGTWQMNRTDTLAVTLRHSLRKQARGSASVD